jgi:hypothetical protein
MNDFFSTLKGKLGPLPIYVWALLGTAALALFLINRKNKAAASGSDQAAADQSNSDLGSAAELANFFNVAGLMPYQGGDVYVNTTQTNNPPPDNTTTTPPPIQGGNPPKGGTIPPPKVTPPATNKPRAIYRVKPGDNLTSIAKKYGISEAELWKYNIDPKVRTASAIKTLKTRGQNLIYSNEAIYIPPTTYK